MLISRIIPHSRPTISDEDFAAMHDILKSGMISAGRAVTRFEESLCKYIGGTSAIATSSGKSALVLALSVLGIRDGDEVIVPTYVCKSVMDAVMYAGAKPVLADIDDDYCISPEDIARRITEKTKAIVVVHIFGISAKIREIVEIGKKYDIRVIEDCAQSIGGEIDGKKLGSFSDLSFFSFHATKVITTGEGGMVMLNSPGLLDSFIQTKQSVSAFFGLSDLQAGLGITQLQNLPGFINKRKALAETYLNKLSGGIDIQVPVTDTNRSMFFRFPVRMNADFDRLRRELETKGIHVRKGVDSLLHHYMPGTECPHADKLFRETVSLPLYPMLELSDIDYIIANFTTVSHGSKR